jgi:transcriptional regulator with XRE-family HTH domain
MIVSEVKKFRVFRNITQHELSKITGICINTIRLIESQEHVNISIPKYQYIKKIADALEVNVESLLFKIDD